MSTPEKTDVKDNPIYWFAVLTNAREAGQYGQAVAAIRELQRLGIQVSFPANINGRNISQEGEGR